MVAKIPAILEFVQIFAIRVRYGVILILLRDISDYGFFLGRTALLQIFPYELDCYLFALLLRIRIRHTLDKFAPLEGKLLVVGLFLVLDQTFYILFAVQVHLFSLNIGIILISFVLLAYS